jgi:carbonic anhydrase
MDPRLSDLEGILGLKHADMDVIRDGGPAVTDEVLGELVVSTRVLGTRVIMLLNHTGCGFTTFTDNELNAKLSKSRGMHRRFLSVFCPTRIRTNTQRNRLGRLGRILGSPRKCPREVSAST